MEDPQFANMDSWKGGGGSKFGLTFKQIILMHINRCIQNGSVEFRGGFWEHKIIGGMSEKQYTPDSKDVYCNSIKMLRVLLIPYFDKAMEEKDNILNKKIKDKQEVWIEKLYGTQKEMEKQVHSIRNVQLHLELFEELIKLSKRLNFFEEEGSEEQM